MPERTIILQTDSERRLLRKSRIVVLSGELFEGTEAEIIEDFEIMSNGNSEPITLIIASEGGDAFTGLAIIRAIKKAQSQNIKVIGEVHGHAMSMAFFVLQCCDERIMGKYDHLMCHGITTITIGDMKNVESERGLLLKLQHDFAELIAHRCTAEGTDYKEHGYWHAILEDNTPQFYSAEESLKMGLIDKVV